MTPEQRVEMHTDAFLLYEAEGTLWGLMVLLDKIRVERECDNLLTWAEDARAKLGFLRRGLIERLQQEAAAPKETVGEPKMAQPDEGREPPGSL